MKKTIFWIVSWIISALILIPCEFLSLINGFKTDYHYEFHLWWYEKYLNKLKND